jgi:hypothetical protein
VSTNLTTWLAQGYALVPAGATAAQEDEVAQAYTYGEAYEAKAALMAGKPNSASLAGEFSASSTDKQRQWFLEKAVQWRAALARVLAEIEAASSPAVVTGRPYGSTTQRTVVSF